MKYTEDNPLTDYLPRIVKKKRCNALDDDGNPCKNKALIETTIHSDPEIQPIWVHVNLCEVHAWSIDLKCVGI